MVPMASLTDSKQQITTAAMCSCSESLAAAEAIEISHSPQLNGELNSELVPVHSYIGVSSLLSWCYRMSLPCNAETSKEPHLDSNEPNTFSNKLNNMVCSG